MLHFSILNKSLWQVQVRSSMVSTSRNFVIRPYLKLHNQLVLLTLGDRLSYPAHLLTVLCKAEIIVVRSFILCLLFPRCTFCHLTCLLRFVRPLSPPVETQVKPQEKEQRTLVLLKYFVNELCAINIWLIYHSGSKRTKIVPNFLWEVTQFLLMPSFEWTVDKSVL